MDMEGARAHRHNLIHRQRDSRRRDCSGDNPDTYLAISGLEMDQRRRHPASPAGRTCSRWKNRRLLALCVLIGLASLARAAPPGSTTTTSKPGSSGVPKSATGSTSKSTTSPATSAGSSSSASAASSSPASKTSTSTSSSNSANVKAASSATPSTSSKGATGTVKPASKTTKGVSGTPTKASTVAAAKATSTATTKATQSTQKPGTTPGGRTTKAAAKATKKRKRKKVKTTTTKAPKPAAASPKKTSPTKVAVASTASTTTPTPTVAADTATDTPSESSDPDSDTDTADLDPATADDSDLDADTPDPDADTATADDSDPDADATAADDSDPDTDETTADNTGAETSIPGAEATSSQEPDSTSTPSTTDSTATTTTVTATTEAASVTANPKKDNREVGQSLVSQSTTSQVPDPQPVQTSSQVTTTEMQSSSVAVPTTVTDTQVAGDDVSLFKLTSVDEMLQQRTCGSAERSDRFHPCPVVGSCSFCNNTCTPHEPRSCDAGGAGCEQARGCGKSVVVKLPKSELEGCRTGTGPGESGYYCASASSTAAQCCALCDQHREGGVTGSSGFKCSGWMLVNPNSGTENSQCGQGSGWVSQKGANSSVVTPYYGGCGWCLLQSEDQCSPTCSVKGMDAPSGDESSNVYWALYGRSTCAYGKNDPHFTGADGTPFEFNGLPEESFCLLSDKALHVNMKMHGYYDERTLGASIVRNGKALRTWIRELGIVWRTEAEIPKVPKIPKMPKMEGSTSDGAHQRWTEHKLRLVARNGTRQDRGEGFMSLAGIDGESIPHLKVNETWHHPSGLAITFKEMGKHGRLDIDRYHLSIPGLLEMGISLRIAHPLLQTPTDAEAHFNIIFDAVNHSPSIHGIVGQTYRRGRGMRSLDFRTMSSLLGHPISADGDNGAGYLDGASTDYLSSSVLATDCEFSSFGETES